MTYLQIDIVNLGFTNDLKPVLLCLKSLAPRAREMDTGEFYVLIVRFRNNR